MIRTALTCFALLAAAPAVASDLYQREVLQEQPLADAPDLTVMIRRVTLKPGGREPLHSHAGDEHAVVLSGGRVELAGGAEATLSEGDTLFYSAGDVHGGMTNLGQADIVLLTTHVVNVLEPFSSPAE